MSVERQHGRALIEVAVIAGAYIVISTTAVSAFDVSALFPTAWLPVERATGSSFLIGALTQVSLVLLAAYVFRRADFRAAITLTVAASTRKAWSIAVIATAIHVGTGIFAILPQPERVGELSQLNLILSVIPAVDGWSQEVLFRGYVLLRLARARVVPLAQIVISGAMFAAIHLGYTGETTGAFLAPLIGTFMLGCFYAWAVQLGRGSLKPVIVCHVAIILILQPWLALAQ